MTLSNLPINCIFLLFIYYIYYFLFQTETIIQRLERVLSLSGTTSVDPHFITDVILPEALIQWLQATNVICRFQAEDLLMKTKPFIDNEGKAELAINDDTPKVKHT
uniref:Uncharacterized protein n=1 Tax=Nothobranchius pienaari TaxID=704102 RepID=A0A1A8MSK5_9TELE